MTPCCPVCLEPSVLPSSCGGDAVLRSMPRLITALRDGDQALLAPEQLPALLLCLLILSSPLHLTPAPSFSCTTDFPHLPLKMEFIWKYYGLFFSPAPSLASLCRIDVLRSCLSPEKKEAQMSLFEIIFNAWLAVTLPVLINLFKKEVSTLQWSWQRLATNLFAFSAKMIHED